MKREVDLCRQLLFDLEGQGTDCSLKSLRSGLAHDADERIRYHLRLLIDAGLVKEIDRTSAGVPCVRLTNSGQEFVELSRGEARWREAKWIVQEQTGGQSLTVLRALLTKWAVEACTRGERYRRYRRPLRAPYYRYEPTYRVESARYEREPHLEEDEDLRLLRSRPDYRERFEFYDRFFDRDGYTGFDVEPADAPVGVTMPVTVL